MLMVFLINLGLIKVISHPLDKFHLSINVQARGWAGTEYDHVSVVLEWTWGEIRTQWAYTCGICRIIKGQKYPRSTGGCWA